MKLALDKRVILYFDILGYKQKFEEENFSSIEYLQTIRSVMSKVQEYAKTVGSIVLKFFQIMRVWFLIPAIKVWV